MKHVIITVSLVQGSPMSSPGRYKTGGGPLKASTSSTSLLSMTHQTSSSTCSVCKTKLQLVDLAGSECVGMSGVTGTALREAQSINKRHVSTAYVNFKVT